MAKYVKCIQGDLGVPLTDGNCYRVMGDDNVGYLIEDDSGSLEWWNKYRFEEPYDLPEAITFSSQQEFDNAVMKVVLERLQIQTKQFDLFGRKITDYYNTSVCVDSEDKQ
jgi:hypothetical protein